MESYNAILIEKGIEQKERMIELRNLARTQLLSLENIGNIDIKKLEKNNKYLLYNLNLSERNSTPLKSK